jgi:hypothetical protein
VMFLSLKVGINRLGCLDWTSNVNGLRVDTVVVVADSVWLQSTVGLGGTCSGRFVSAGSSSWFGLTEDNGADAMKAWCQYLLCFFGSRNYFLKINWEP